MKIRLINLTIIVLVVIVGISGCAAPATQLPATQAAPTQPPATQAQPTKIPVSLATPQTKLNTEIVLKMIELLNSGDVEGSLAYFADDATAYLVGLPPTGMEVYRGKEQIRSLWEDSVANHFEWQVKVESATGDIVMIRAKTWHDFTRQIGVAPLEYTDIYEVVDNKILTYSSTITEEALARLKPALAEVMPPEPTAEPSNDPPMSAMTVTIAEGTCTADVPLTLQEGEVQVTVDVKDQDQQMYAVTFFTLEPEKDILDLMATTVQPVPPAWSNMFSIEEIEPGKSKSYSITVTDGPVYGICWSQPPDLAIGALGPFSVLPVLAAATPTSAPREIPDSDIVATFSNGKCALDLPEILPTGEISVTLNVEDLNDGPFALAFFNLDEGKELSDLLASQDSPAPPPWAYMFSMRDASPGAIKSYNVTIEKGPVYLLCWTEERVIGWMGPIEVSQ